MATPIEQYYAQLAAKKQARQTALAEATKILEERRRQAAVAADARAQRAGDYATPSGEIDRSMGRLSTYGSQFVRGIGGMVAAVPKAAADVTQLATGYDPTPLREAGEGIEGFFNQADVNPEYAEEFGGKVARGIGTTAGFFLGGAAGAGLKGASLAAKGARAATALKGAALGAKFGMPVSAGISEMSEDFQRTTGRAPTREELATLVPTGVGLGAMEYLPVSRGLGRFGRAVGGEKVAGGILGQATLGAAEEAIQEGTQQIAQNYAAKSIAQYDKDREVLAGLGEAASVGGASGFIINAALTAAGVKLRKSRQAAETGTPQTEEEQEQMAEEQQQVEEEVVKATTEQMTQDADQLSSLRSDIMNKRIAIARAKESEATNPEEVKAMEEDLRSTAEEYLALRREGSVASVEEITLEGEEDPRIVESRQNLSDAMTAFEEEEAAGERADLAYAARGMELEEAPVGEYAQARVKEIYGDNLALAAPKDMGGVAIPLEEWDAGPIKGQYPGRNFVRSSEAKVTGRVNMPPAVKEAMKADTQEANTQQEEKIKKATPVSVPAKRGYKAKSKIAQMASVLDNVKAAAPTTETTGNAELDNIKQSISEWADQKGTVSSREFNGNMGALKKKMKDLMVEQAGVNADVREINKAINKYVKSVTPTKAVTEEKAAEAEAARPTTVDSFVEEVLKMEGATANEDGSITVEIPMDGTVEGPVQMKELIQHENLSGVRNAFNDLRNDLASQGDARVRYSDAFRQYVMSRLERESNAPEHLIRAEVTERTREVMNELSNEGILPPEFATANANQFSEIANDIAVRYIGGTRPVAEFVDYINEYYPLDPKTGKRSVKHRFPVDLQQKQALEEALKRTGLFIKSYNKTTGDAVLVNENKHTVGRSPIEVLGNAPETITTTRQQIEEMVNPPENVPPPAAPSPYFNEEEAAKASPVTTQDDTVQQAETRRLRDMNAFLSNLGTREIRAMSGPELTRVIKEYIQDDVPHRLDARRDLIEMYHEIATGQIGYNPDASWSWLHPDSPEQGGEIQAEPAQYQPPIEEEIEGEVNEVVVPAPEGGAFSRLQAYNREIPEVAKEEIETSGIDPTKHPFHSEGATPRIESGEELELSALETKAYNGEKLTAEEQARLDEELINELSNIDDYVTPNNQTDEEELYRTYVSTHPQEVFNMYAPAGKAIREVLSTKLPSGHNTLNNILRYMQATLPETSADKKLTDRLLALNLATTIELVPSLRSPEGKMVGGEYHKTNEHIKLSNEAFDEDISKIVLHEAVHAATIHAYGYDTKFREEFDNIFAAAKAAYEKLPKKIDGVDYAMTEATEFLAEIFTNPRVMKFANDVKYTKSDSGFVTDLLTAFIRAVSKFFGIDINDSSVLREALVVGSTGFRSQTQIEYIKEAELDQLYAADQEMYNAPLKEEKYSTFVGQEEEATTTEGKRIKRPFAPQHYDENEMQSIMQEIRNISEQLLDNAHGAAARMASGWYNYVRNMKPFTGYRLLKDMIDQRSYLAARNLSMGDASTFDEMGNYFGRFFNNLKKSEMNALTAYMIDKAADVKNLPKHLQKNAQYAKEEIIKMGDELVKLGVLDPKLHEATKGGYLGRMYILFMTLPNERGQVSTTGGTGARTSLMEYLKKRTLEEGGADADIQELYGFVQDPAFRTASTIAKVGRDIAIFRFMRSINTFSQMQGEDPWVFPDVEGEKFRLQLFDESGKPTRLSDPKTLPQALAELKNMEKRVVTHGLKSQREIEEGGESMAAGYVRHNTQLIQAQLQKLHRERAEAIQDPEAKEKFLKGNYAELDISNYTELSDDRRNGDLAGKWVRNEIFNDLRSNTFAFSTENASTAEKLLGQNSALTKGNKIWKATKTIYNLPAHPRNFISNFINFDTSTSTPTLQVMRLVYETAKEWYQAHKQGLKYPNDPVWRLADANGMTEMTWTAQESIQFGNDWQFENRATQGSGWVRSLPDGQTKTWLQENMPHITGRGVSFLSKIAQAYQGNETIFRVAKLKDELNRLKASNPEATDIEWKALQLVAVEKANEAIFDYTNVTQSVKYFRNAPIGAPFISFSYLAAPRIIENTVKHPMKMMKYMLLPYVMGELAASLGVFDGDDWETAKNKAPGFLKDKHTLLPMPWKDENGDPMVWDLAYYLPYAPFLETAHQYKNILTGRDTETSVLEPAIRNFGILTHHEGGCQQICFSSGGNTAGCRSRLL